MSARARSLYKEQLKSWKARARFSLPVVVLVLVTHPVLAQEPLEREIESETAEEEPGEAESEVVGGTESEAEPEAGEEDTKLQAIESVDGETGIESSADDEPQSMELEVLDGSSAEGENETENDGDTGGTELEAMSLESLASAHDDEHAASADRFRRTTASGAYSGPTLQFFALHGYATLTYAVAEDSFGASYPQILLPGISPALGENLGGFRSDAAVFVGTDSNLDVSATVEIHFVGTGFDPIVTEAKVVWQLSRMWEDKLPQATLRLVGGRFWWPFGQHNPEWFSSVNRFNTISPATSLAVPAHHNETGLMAEGELELMRHLGLSWLFAIGNGPRGFALSDNVPAGPFDFDGNRTMTGRLEVGWDDIVRVGFSAAGGRFRSPPADPMATPDPADGVNAFGAKFTSLGPHASLQIQGFEALGFVYFSKEELDDAPRDRLDRIGVLAEAQYRLPWDVPVLSDLMPKFRYSWATVDELTGGDSGFQQLGFGVNYRPHPQLLAKVEYVLNRSEHFEDVSEDVFNVSLSGSF